MDFFNTYFGLIVYSVFTFFFFLKFNYIKKIAVHFANEIKLNGVVFNLIILFAVATLFLSLLFFNSSMSDIVTHMRVAKDLFSNPTGHFLYFFLVKFFGLFSNHELVLIASSVLILSISVWLKYKVSFAIFKNYLKKKVDVSEKQLKIASIILIVSIFSLPLITYPLSSNLLSVFTFNVWHNSTTIFLMPFALGLFYISYKFISGYRFKNDVLIMVLLVALNIISKPSFFLVFAAVFPLFSFYKFRFLKEFWISLGIVFWGLFLLFLQFLIIYKFNNSDDSGVSIQFFYVFSSSNKVFYLLSSFVKSYFFPILFLLINFKELIKKDFYLYSLASLFFAVIIYFNITETGLRANHGNFVWQIVVTGYIWFFVSIICFLEKIFKEKLFNFTSKILVWSIGLHLVSFVVWFMYYIELKLW